MKKKLLIPLIFAPIMALASCGGSNPHEHTFSSAWSSDSISHWHDATCEHTELISNKGNHVDTNNDHICDICEYEIEVKYYSVIWKNYNGDILEIDESVEEGSIPTCDVTPIKEDGEYIYHHTGWSPEVVPVSGNAVYTAVFEKDTTKYKVIFEDTFGNVVNEQLVTAGELPDMSLINTDPQVDTNTVVIFEGLDRELERVSKNTTYICEFIRYYLTYTAEQINDAFSLSTLGDNFSLDISWYPTSPCWTQHFYVCDQRLKIITSYDKSHPSYGEISERYEDTEWQYYYVKTVEGETTCMKIRKDPAHDSLDNTISMYLNNFITDADYVFDITTGKFISTTSSNNYYLSFKNGKFNSLEVENKGNIGRFDILSNITLNNVLPFEIPKYNWIER